MPTTYTDADEMPESAAGGNNKKKFMKANNIAMAYFHLEVESGKATGCLANTCDDD